MLQLQEHVSRTKMVPGRATATLALVLIGSAGRAVAYDNGATASRLPPMGWNSWCTDGFCNAFGRDVCNEELVRSI